MVKIYPPPLSRCTIYNRYDQNVKYFINFFSTNPFPIKKSFIETNEGATKTPQAGIQSHQLCPKPAEQLVPAREHVRLRSRYGTETRASGTVAAAAERMSSKLNCKVHIVNTALRSRGAKIQATQGLNFEPRSMIALIAYLGVPSTRFARTWGVPSARFVGVRWLQALRAKPPGPSNLQILVRFAI